jgi:simple sugar transport system substrate-binding protein
MIVAGLAGLAALSLVGCSVGSEVDDATSTGVPDTSDPSASTDASTGTDSGYTLTPKDLDGDGLITVGFAQVGAESGWRTANTDSYKEYFVEENGFKLVFADANQDADKQKQDVRDLISQGVELIDLAPVTDSGWEPVLQEAKDAGIPLIISDRQLSVPEDLYLTYFGGDMRAEGDRVVDWIKSYAADQGITDPINVVHLQGTMGSSAQKGRSEALSVGAPANDWNVVYEQTGEFTQAKGQEVMESFLQQGKDFNVIYSENDDMTYGAIDALVAHGLDPKDYIIASFDGNKSAVQMVVDGTIDVIGECDPLLGPQVGELIKQAAAGETIAKITYSTEGLIDSTNAADKVTTAFGS